MAASSRATGAVGVAGACGVGWSGPSALTVRAAGGCSSWYLRQRGRPELSQFACMAGRGGPRLGKITENGKVIQ